MSEQKPTYIIVAGVNGAGKSTLYQIAKEEFQETQRVNTDEILRQNQGDWQSSSDNAKAGKETVRLMNDLIENQTNFHQETTLAGSLKGHVRRIQKAKANGFQVKLLYVALDHPKRAVERVNQRVQKGGHGIPTDTIINRYFKSLENLKGIVNEVDNYQIYENNTDKIKMIKKANSKDFDLSYWLENRTALPRKEEILKALKNN